MAYIHLMLTLNQQKERYEENWLANKHLYSTQTMNDDPEPIFAIGFIIEKFIRATMQPIVDTLKLLDGSCTDEFVPLEEMHVTVHLPGRVGVHFLESEIIDIVTSLRKICSKRSSFFVQLGNLNVFPNVLFREVYDPTGLLYELHNEIVSQIPFAESPDFTGENFMPHMSLRYVRQTGSALLENENFSRVLSLERMEVKSIYFTKCYDFANNQQIADFALGAK